MKIDDVLFTALGFAIVVFVLLWTAMGMALVGRFMGWW